MTRSATSSIRGYQYQFCKSIVQVLSFQNENDSLVVEGIEDIEGLMGEKHEAVQVKYHEAGKLIPSKIRRPVSQMLEDYVTNAVDRQHTTYRLYGHFGQGGGSDKFWTREEFFVKCRSDVVSEVTDDHLNAFMKKFELEIGPSLSELQMQAKQLLEKVLGVTSTEVEHYYYNNALNLVIDLATRDEEKRSITKSAFIEKIDQKCILYGAWQKIELGHNAYKLTIKRQLKPDLANPKNRLIILDAADLSEDPTGYALSRLIQDLVTHYNPINKLDSTEPLTVVAKMPSEDLTQLKVSLLDQNFEYNDGHEDNQFHAGSFNASMITNVRSKSHKISKVSYNVRILSFSTYLSFLEQITKHDTIICISREILPVQENTVAYHLSQLETYRDVSEILY